MVIEHDHVAGAHAAAHFPGAEIHGHVQVFFDDKVGRSPAGQQSTKLHSVPHSSGMLLENFAHGGAHGQFPKARMFYFSAHAK